MNFVYFWPFGGVSLRRAKTSFSFNLTHSLKIENLRKIVKNDPDFRLSARLLYFFSCFTQGMCLSEHVIFKFFDHVTRLESVLTVVHRARRLLQVGIWHIHSSIEIEIEFELILDDETMDHLILNYKIVAILRRHCPVDTIIVILPKLEFSKTWWG